MPRSWMVAALLGALLAALGSASAVEVLDCGRSNSGLATVNNIKTSELVTCPPGCLSVGGSVWGSGVYTADSRICLAAIHAGILKGNKGGKFKIFYERGRASYLASRKNGVTTNKWGSYTSSFKFVPPALPPTADCDTSNTMLNIVGPTRPSLRIVCPSGCLATGGSVYGTGVYTSDSRLCLAAIHAGVIRPSGGPLTVYHAPGQTSYRASTANGITSREYGSWGNSIRFTPLTRLACNRTNAGTPAQPALVTAASPVATVVCPRACDNAANKGPIYGRWTYSSDSHICLAAIHAGVITREGGGFILRYEKGLASYPAVSAYGVTSLKRGAAAASFKFS